MTRTTYLALVMLIVPLGLLCHSSVSVGAIVDYSFDGSLSSNTGQVDLEAVGYPGVANAPSVTYATDTIGGEAASVAKLTKGTALVVRHGAGANGGGAYLNQYTLIMDVKFPVVGDWMSLYQTNDAFDDATATFDLSDSNDGDWFVNPSLGIGITGNYGGTIGADTWHRLALVVDTSEFSFTSYIDGAQVQQNTGAPAIDGRFALYGPGDPDPYDWFLLFADETADAAEMGAVDINHFQFRDEALSADAIAALGGASATGIPVPEPGSWTLILAGSMLMFARRRHTL